MGVEVPSNPINRKEQYLAKIAGQAVEIPAEPLTREEAYLDEIAKNGSGGGGGTTNYNLLENKPQIAGTELQGNKSLADLGIASASDLAAKQNALTAGDYIDITNDEISVDREIPSVIAEYEIKTEPMVEGQAFISVTKTVNGEVVLTQKYGSSTAGINQGINFDENIYVDYSKTAAWSWTYKLRNASVDHAADYTQSWNYGSTVDYTEEFIVTDHSGDKLVIKSEMDTAMATKTDTDMVAADFNAGTSYTAGNYCVQDGKLYKFKNNHSGAWSAADVDEVKITGELSALKSGLTNLVTLGVIPTANNNYTLSQYSYGKAKCGIITLFLDITCQTPDTSDFVEIGYIDNTNLIATYGGVIGEVNGGDNITIQLEMDGKIKAIYGTATKEYRGLVTFVN